MSPAVIQYAPINSASTPGFRRRNPKPADRVPRALLGMSDGQLFVPASPLNPGNRNPEH
jgi:hypothetical protein